MNDASSKRWLSPVIFTGVIYLAVAVGSSALARAAASERIQFFWRLSAFVISGAVLLVHVAYEHYRLRNRTFSAAWHVSLGAAVGGFLIALIANIHDLGSATGYRHRMLIALIAWPLLTSVPAFIVALVIAALLGLKRQRD